MPIFDAGLFSLMMGTGFLSLLLSFKIGGILKVISAIVFFSLAIIMFGQYEVAYVSELTGTSNCTVADPCVETKYLIQNNQSWLAWILVAFAIFSSLLFFLEMIGMFDEAPAQRREDTF